MKSQAVCTALSTFFCLYQRALRIERALEKLLHLVCTSALLSYSREFDAKAMALDYINSSEECWDV